MRYSNFEDKYNHALVREALLLEAILKTMGLTYDATDNGFVILDKDGCAYGDEDGNIRYFANSTEVLDGIGWLLDDVAVSYSFAEKSYQSSECKMQSTELDL